MERFPRRAGVATLTARRSLTPKMIRVTLRADDFRDDWPIQQPGEIITLQFGGPVEIPVRDWKPWRNYTVRIPSRRRRRDRRRRRAPRAARTSLRRRRSRCRSAGASATPGRGWTSCPATTPSGCCYAVTRRRCRRSPRSSRSRRCRTCSRSSRCPTATRNCHSTASSGSTAMARPPRPRQISPTRCVRSSSPTASGRRGARPIARRPRSQVGPARRARDAEVARHRARLLAARRRLAPGRLTTRLRRGAARRRPAPSSARAPRRSRAAPSDRELPQNARSA